MQRLLRSVALLATAAIVGLVMIVSAIVSITLQAAAWPFARTQEICAQVIRDIHPGRAP